MPMINYLDLWDKDQNVKRGLSIIWDELGEDLRAKALSVCLMPVRYVDYRLEDVVG